VTEKNMGPLIKTFMTRCIHCTRCVRFSEEVAGVDEIGALYRGEDMQITTYLEQAAKHELSAQRERPVPGRRADASARTSSRRGRGSSRRRCRSTFPTRWARTIRVDCRGREVLRVLPRTNDDVNEEWLSDKARWQVEGLTRRRLDARCGFRRNGKLEQASWDEAFAAIAKAKPGNRLRRWRATCSTARRCSRRRNCSARLARR
jgi:NADH-quinone oxidoreductase subunit G